jgi:hypothetical protein
MRGQGADRRARVVSGANLRTTRVEAPRRNGKAASGRNSKTTGEETIGSERIFSREMIAARKSSSSRENSFRAAKNTFTQQDYPL